MTGEFKSTLDSKGRMNVPIKLREEFGERFFISKTIGSRCIKVYKVEDWQALVSKIDDMPLVQAQPVRRHLIGSAYEVIPDKQGRISVPPTLREYAKLSLDVVVVGVGKYAEIWDKAEWILENEQRDNETLAELATVLNI